jgi:hypothetical protein
MDCKVNDSEILGLNMFKDLSSPIYNSNNLQNIKYIFFKKILY